MERVVSCFNPVKNNHPRQVGTYLFIAGYYVVVHRRAIFIMLLGRGLRSPAKLAKPAGD